MKVEDLYSVFRFIASRKLKALKKDNGWRSDWKEYHLRNLSSPYYEDVFVDEFREKQMKSGDLGKFRSTLERLDFMLCWIFLGATPEDYFSMLFNRKGWIWRNHHVTKIRMRFLKRKFNHDSKSRNLLDDKASFYRHWQEHLHRKWCIPEELSFEEFEEKFNGANTIIAKRRQGFGGKGIIFFDMAERDLRSVYDEIISEKDDYIVEEYHNQTGWLHDVNPSSLNTIRVATISINGKTDVIFAYLRVGIEGSHVDNLHSGGIRFPIDHHTGRILKGMNYQICDVEAHPDSGISLYGETIPKWDEIVEFCRNAHDLAPESLHLVGWDICLDEDDMILIEGNSGPGFPPIDNPHDDWWRDMGDYLSQLESNNP